MRAVVSANRSMVEGPWLSTHLPSDALAYLRLPDFLGMLGSPKGSMYSQAVGSVPYASARANPRRICREYSPGASS